jgi:hypothetical protein
VPASTEDIMVAEADPRLLKALRELSQERELRIKYQRSAAAWARIAQRLRRSDSARSNGNATVRPGALGRGKAPTRSLPDSR